jgi:hypothetical protein
LLVVVAFAERVAKVSPNNFRFPVDSEIPPLAKEATGEKD